ncbi:MAG TPA: 3-isopropylmalate dehydratase large subunit [Candidatus Baltobacteraceae bacterium]
MAGATMFDKIWDAHVVATLEDGSDLLYIDRHIMHDLTSLKAFADLERSGQSLRRPDLTLAVQDHLLATNEDRNDLSYDKGTVFIQAQRRNSRAYGVALLDINDAEQGIIHVVGPELGVTLPGLTLACGDSHTCTNGGLGALAFGLGTSDVTHVLATQTLPMKRPEPIRVTVEGRMGPGLYAKDMILYIISQAGSAAGNGMAVEYAGAAVRALSIEARLTLCNMSIEWGARIGMVAPDDVTYEYLADRRYAPKGSAWESALQYWRTLPSDVDAHFEREISVDATRIAPQITWGTNPMDTIGVDEPVPNPEMETSSERREAMARALRYTDLRPGTSMEGLPIDVVFIGSCTNSRISDLRVAADVAKGRKVAPGIRAMVVPGSSSVKRQAEAEGLDRIFKEAGFEWHASACSMCAAVNADFVPPGARCVSTANRNYENRQGRDSRTHLASPAMAAGAAVSGKIVDVRKLMQN